MCSVAQLLMSETAKPGPANSEVIKTKLGLEIVDIINEFSTVYICIKVVNFCDIAINFCCNRNRGFKPWCYTLNNVHIPIYLTLK